MEMFTKVTGNKIRCVIKMESITSQMEILLKVVLSSAVSFLAISLANLKEKVL